MPVSMPIAVRSDAPEALSGSPLLDKITLNHGPVALLGRVLLATERLAGNLGVKLSFSTGEEVLDANRQNSDTWLPLLRLFDVRYNDLTADNCLFLVGRDSVGDVVAVQGARLYDWTGTNCADAIESMSLFYDEPARMADPDEAYRVTSLAARGTSGRCVYSGGAWYRPDYRGKGLVKLLPRFARAYARAVWDVRTTVTFMSEQNVHRGVYPRNGYANLEWAIDINNRDWGNVRYAYLWLKSDETERDLQSFLGSLETESGSLDRAVGAE
ncbi:MAG: hypothetical protein AAGC70_17085 [Pseudomonadota bacterium]